MLDIMRQLALDSLWSELDEAKSKNPERWYRSLRETEMGKLFPKLVEDTSIDGEAKFYTLSANPEDVGIAVLDSEDLTADKAARLPFNQPAGSQAPAIGPVIKRTAPASKKPAGPSIKIQETTLNFFQGLGQAKSRQPWSDYFQHVHQCWSRPKLQFRGEILDAKANGYAHAYHAAIARIDEKRTVFLAYKENGKLPGDVPEYVEYLQQILTDTKYTTGSNPSLEGRTCALCGQGATKVYPNSLRGAGINLANLDRHGAFPGVEPSEAWKGYSLCAGCADLLYVYCRHVAKNYLTRIAGETALVLPSTQIEPALRKKFIERIQSYVQATTKKDVRTQERLLENLVGEDRAVTTITLMWADFGQRIDNLRGIVGDVLPSRLRVLSAFHVEFKKRTHPIFPEAELGDFQYTLSLSILHSLFKRPGGRKAQSVNDSKRLFDLRRDLAEHIYHGTPVAQRRLFAELHRTAQWHWDDTLGSGFYWGLLHEGAKDKKGQPYLTFAGWIRQVARFLFYLRTLEVLSMDTGTYTPQSERLAPYFGEESAVSEPKRAFAFLLGVLFGKLMQVQAARKVNVGANSLTWLKRLTLTGRDLPELHNKIREKHLIYGIDRKAEVRAVLTDVAELGVRLGTDIELSDTETCYFLLLGQALATKILPSNAKEETND